MFIIIIDSKNYLFSTEENKNQKFGQVHKTDLENNSIMDFYIIQWYTDWFHAFCHNQIKVKLFYLMCYKCLIKQ